MIQKPIFYSLGFPTQGLACLPHYQFVQGPTPWTHKIALTFPNSLVLLPEDNLSFSHADCTPNLFGACWYKVKYVYKPKSNIFKKYLIIIFLYATIKVSFRVEDSLFKWEFILGFFFLDDCEDREWIHSLRLLAKSNHEVRSLEPTKQHQSFLQSKTHQRLKVHVQMPF